jgi:Uncharacterised nucleotidyltransferase
MDVDEVLRAIAAHGLAAPPTAPLVVVDHEVDALLRAGAAHKVLGLLDQAVADGLVVGEASVTEVLQARGVTAAAGCLLVERHLLEVHERLEGAQMPHRFLKGAAVAHRFHAHPGLRTFVDVDVLVPGDRLAEAIALLEAADHVRLQPDPAPGFTRRFAKSVTVRHLGGVEVDVHRVIADGPFGLRTSSQPLWLRAPATLALGGTAVPVLDAPAAFVQACANAVASYDRVALAALRDVAQIGTAVASQVGEVADLAGALALRPCVTDAVRRAQQELRWEAPEPVASMAGWPVSALERRWLDSYRQRPADLTRALLGLRAVPGAADRARYALGVARLLIGRRRRRALRR